MINKKPLLVVTTRATSIQWVAARDAAKHPAVSAWDLLPEQRLMQPKISIMQRLRNSVYL